MKSHRGLSAIIGAIFLVAIVISAMSYVSYSIGIIGNFSESLIVGESRQMEKQNESFEITSVEVTDLDKLNPVIKNTGEIPLKITNLYIDEQGTNDIVQKIIIDKTIAPGSSFNFLAEGIDVDIDSTKGYNLKMSTSRGTTESFFVNSGSAEPLYMTLHAFPSAVSTGFPSSIIFNVVNNMSNGNVLYNLTPILDVDSETGLGTVASSVGPFPTSYPSLKYGDVATFEYIYTVSGDEGQFIDLGISLQNGYELPSNPGHLQSLNSSVLVKDVEVAITAGSSITSFGLQTSETIDADVMYFHDNTYGITAGWPSDARQMSGSKTFGTGTLEYTENGPIIHVTSNMTASTTVDAGQYTAALQYYSDPVVSALPYPDVAFFFECENCPTTDQTTEFIGELDYINNEHTGWLEITKEASSDPVWSEFGGPDNDGYFSFTQVNSFFEGGWDGDHADNTFNSISTVPDTDSMWVKIPSTTLDYMPLLFMGEKAGKDEYEISIGDAASSTDDGKIVFRFEDEEGTGGETKCITDDRYDNNNWQLITVIRTGGSTTHDTDCEIWINATDTEATVSPDGGDFDLDTQKYTGLGNTEKGKDGMETSTQELNADIAMWIHWNDAELTGPEIEDLYYTNYGENGTRINMTVSIYDDTYSTLRETVLDVNNAILPFHDVSKNSLNADTGTWTMNPLFSDTSNLAKFKYSQANVSGTTLSNSTLITGDRLTLEIDVDADEHNLPINLWIDDFDLVGATVPEMNSFLQTPNTNPAWPTFNTVTSEAETTLVIFNDGPDGMWFVFSGTRFLVSTIDGLTSYGAMPIETDAIEYLTTQWNLRSDIDGPYIPDQGEVELTFTKLCSPATTNKDVLDGTAGYTACTNIPAGDYLGFVFLSGYDEAGQNFIKTIQLGNIHVEPAP